MQHIGQFMFETRWNWFYVRLLKLQFSTVQLCLIVEVVNFQTFDCVWLAKVLGKFDCVWLLNPVIVNWMLGVQLSLITKCSIDYAGNKHALSNRPFLLWEKVWTEKQSKFNRKVMGIYNMIYLPFLHMVRWCGNHTLSAYWTQKTWKELRWTNREV